MKNTNRYFVGYWHYGVILTYLSAVAGIMGICFSAMGRPVWGVICLLASGLCDAFDGIVAKTRKGRLNEDKIFGSQIDSLSDLISFGVAPVMIGFGMGMRKWYFIVLYCAFVLCALIRLAYYNVEEELSRSNPEEHRRESFFGLPVTNIAVALPVFYLVATMFRQTSIVWSVMAVCYILVAFLFVFRFRMPKLRAKGLSVTIIILTVIIIALVLVRHYVCGSAWL